MVYFLSIYRFISGPFAVPLIGLYAGPFADAFSVPYTDPFTGLYSYGIGSKLIIDKSKLIYWAFRVKKTSLGESLAKSHAYNPIRDCGETLGEREKSCRESHQESSRDSLRDSRSAF